MAAAVMKSFLVIVIVLAGLAAHSQLATAQNCSAGLGQLTVCAPFVLPGVSNGPTSQECCSALQGIDHGCLCNTIDIINRLPASCNLPPVTCSA